MHTGNAQKISFLRSRSMCQSFIIFFRFFHIWGSDFVEKFYAEALLGKNMAEANFVNNTGIILFIFNINVAIFCVLILLLSLS